MPTSLLKPTYKNVIRYVGDAGHEQDILRRRRLSLETFRRMGTPVLLKHMYTIEDVEKEEAILSPEFDTTYRQPTHDDPFSYGVGYVSKETARGEWMSPYDERETRELIITDNPPKDFEPAPMYRGYGPGYLTYVILPDVPVDIFKLTEEGALIRTQQAKIQLPWWPIMKDNDLMITVELDASERIIDTFERYQLKQVNPITMRGHDRMGRRETHLIDAASNRRVVGQQCEANKVPETDPIYGVETDR